MSSPSLGPGGSPTGSSSELYLTTAEKAVDNPSHEISTISRYSLSKSIACKKKPLHLDWNPSAEAVADYVTDLFEAGGVNHDFCPAEAQEFVDTMRAIRKPTGNKITRNTQKGISAIAFRPKHGLSDIHGLGLFLEKKGGFAGCVADVEQKYYTFNEKEGSHSSVHLTNYRDLAYKNYHLLWENRASENSEEYELPKSRYSASTIWPEKKKTPDQLEKQLSYQKRLLHRAVEKMHIDGKPFDPAFTRIFMLTDKDLRINEITLSSAAKVTGIFFEYKAKEVPLEEEKACIAEIDAMPTHTVDQICNAIEADLQADPIKIVDLHKISHLLEKLGGFASSSACVEREYTIDGQERHCTAIILRNRQDLVNERYFQLRSMYGSEYDLREMPPKCDYPVSWLQKKKTTEEIHEQLSYQKELLQKAVEKMCIKGVSFDPLFKRIYIPTDQERLDNGASVFNIAQTDMILFVYAKPENKDLPVHTVDQVCEAIQTMATAEVVPANIEEPNAMSTTLKVAGEVFGFFLQLSKEY
ncbi:hypothetical protein [Candidatus Rhabdochlamydia porcellionis]|jgi:hypothetical protein|uniref:Uncharacterized protein n=1 Tax=Candidatus Rhabdochlamydia porcellionis TaxID=225148 RepID=A0ABX8Z4E2_9BACT|nr:hypothetical protein [Candidatus Rhabdochlamydia porcellionis]QZA59178.1 hypothetical protein RHAB15C_0001063 [Candidatus Rhabdochlamydia porcellionis]